MHPVITKTVAQIPWDQLANPTDVTAGVAVMVAVPYALLSWWAFNFPSPGVMVGWVLMTGFLILTFLTDLSMVTYWLAFILVAVLVGLAAIIDGLDR